MNRSIRLMVMALAAMAGLMLAPGRLGTVSTAAAQDGDGNGAAVESDHGNHAGDHAHHEEAGVIPTMKQGLPAMIAAIIVFFIVLFVLSTQVWPRINKGLTDREEKIRNEIEAAEMAQQQARSALQQYERSLADARAEAQRMLDRTKAEQQSLAAELRAKAEVELNQMRDRARRDIEMAKKAALDELYHEAAGIAASMAGKILQREVNPGDHHRLVEESLGELQNGVRRHTLGAAAGR